MEFSGCGFKFHSGQLYIATSKILQWWIPYLLIYSATNVITCARFRLNQMWWLTKAMVEMKCEPWKKRWNWSSSTKLALSTSWTHDLIAQSVRGIQWLWVQIPLRPTFNSYFKNPSVMNTMNLTPPLTAIWKTVYVYVYIYIYIIYIDR